MGFCSSVQGLFCNLSTLRPSLEVVEICSACGLRSYYPIIVTRKQLRDLYILICPRRPVSFQACISKKKLITQSKNNYPVKKNLITQSKKIITGFDSFVSPGLLVRWSSGLWSFGPLVLWSSGPLVRWSSGPPGPLVPGPVLLATWVKPSFNLNPSKT